MPETVDRPAEVAHLDKAQTVSQIPAHLPGTDKSHQMRAGAIAADRKPLPTQCLDRIDTTPSGHVNTPDQWREYVPLQDPHRHATPDRSNRAFAQGQRQIQFAFSQPLRHFAGTAGAVDPMEIDTGVREPPFLDGQVPRKIEVFGDTADIQRSHFWHRLK